MKRRLFGMVALLLAMLIFLAGCGTSSQPTSSAQTAIEVAAGIAVNEILADLGIKDQALLRRFDFTIGEFINNSDGLIGDILCCDMFTILNAITDSLIFNERDFDFFEGTTLASFLDRFEEMPINDVLARFIADEELFDQLEGHVVGDYFRQENGSFIIAPRDLRMKDVFAFIGIENEELYQLFEDVELVDLLMDPMAVIGHVRVCDAILLFGEADEELLAVFGDCTIREMLEEPTDAIKELPVSELLTGIGVQDQLLLHMMEGILMGDVIEDGLAAFENIKAVDLLSLLGIEDMNLVKILADTTIGEWIVDTRNTVKNVYLHDFLVWIGVESKEILERAGEATFGDLMEESKEDPLPPRKKENMQGLLTQWLRY